MPDCTGTVELTAHSLQWLINLLAHSDYHKTAPQFWIFNVCATFSGLSWNIWLFGNCSIIPVGKFYLRHL